MNNIKKPRKSKKYIFILKGINSEQIDQKYGISIVSNLTNNDEQPVNTTKLTELNDIYSNNQPESISFLDETKRLYQCNVSMIDFCRGENIKNWKYNCFWCRHSFQSEPIGCPIRYVSNKGIKTYFSEISKDKYTIKENITEHKKNLLGIQQNFIFIPIKTNNSSIEIEENEFYYTDGIFCSFNCCKAFINENKHNSLYEHSNFLLTKIYNEFLGKINKDSMSVKKEKDGIKNINPSPHWRLLVEYGGNLTIKEFRENFNKTQYEFHDTVSFRTKFKPLATLFEEKINF
jgi:hypothetical protein